MLVRGNCKEKGGPYALKTSKTEELIELEADGGEPSGESWGFSVCAIEDKEVDFVEAWLGPAAVRELPKLAEAVRARENLFKSISIFAP